jgi:predicted O-methyltransferase YrrM
VSNRTLPLDDRLYGYLLANSLREGPVAQRLRQATASLEMARMQIAPEQGQFMALLVELLGARRILEIGTFTGYSALCMAQALPAEGRILCCDLSREWTGIARSFWREAGVEHLIELRIAPALHTLDQLLLERQEGQYDMAFIDADKSNYANYYERSLELLRPGGLIMFDNTLWGGSVADPDVQDEDTRALRALNDLLLRDGRVSISLVPIGDGLTLARKRGG